MSGLDLRSSPSPWPRGCSGAAPGLPAVAFLWGWQLDVGPVTPFANLSCPLQSPRAVKTGPLVSGNVSTGGVCSVGRAAHPTPRALVNVCASHGNHGNRAWLPVFLGRQTGKCGLPQRPLCEHMKAQCRPVNSGSGEAQQGNWPPPDPGRGRSPSAASRGAGTFLRHSWKGYSSRLSRADTKVLKAT